MSSWVFRSSAQEWRVLDVETGGTSWTRNAYDGERRLRTDVISDDVWIRRGHHVESTDGTRSRQYR